MYLNDFMKYQCRFLFVEFNISNNQALTIASNFPPFMYNITWNLKIRYLNSLGIPTLCVVYNFKNKKKSN